MSDEKGNAFYDRERAKTQGYDKGRGWKTSAGTAEGQGWETPSSAGWQAHAGTAEGQGRETPSSTGW